MLCALALTGVSEAYGETPKVVLRASVGGPVALPAGACADAATGVQSEAAPLVGVAPEDPSEVRAVYHAHGERLQIGAASHDGGRTWSRTPIPDATQCLGGPSQRNLSTNPLFDVGAGASAWLGASWFNDPAEDLEFWAFGVNLHHWPHAGGPWHPGVAPPGSDTSSQNLAVAAHRTDPDQAAVMWTWMDQVPNPFTYAPLGTELRFAVRDGGAWGERVTAYRPGADQLVVNPRLVRSSAGGYVAVFDMGALADLPGAQLGLTAATLPLFATTSSDGMQWSEPKRIGTPEQVVAADPDPVGVSDARVVSVKPDLAAGPGGLVAAVWTQSDAKTVRLARSHDGGRTWSDPEDTVALPGPGIQPAVAFDGRGRIAILFYDAFSDTTPDGRWMIQPRLAFEDAGHWRSIAIDAPFDARRAERCTRTLGLDATRSCESHASALGVQQDLEGLPSGFLASYTVGPPLAADGATDGRIARVSAP